MLEAEAHQTPMLSPEGIKRSKVEGIKAEKQPIPLIERPPKDVYINKEGETMEWLCKWHHHDLQEKGQLKKDQEFIMGDVLNLQAYIGRGGRDTGGEDQVRTIWEGIRLAKHIVKQASKVAPQ